MLVMTPEVSIIMPAYNAELTLTDSVESVLAQTHQNWELIIVNDASSDKTAAIAKVLAGKDNRIRLFTNGSNQGVALSRNVGIVHAKGNYVAFLDSDDLWHKDKLKKQMHFMKETGSVISFTGTSYMNEAGQVSGYVLQAKEKLAYRELLRRNIMSCSSVMVKRDSMLLFAQGYIHEDYAVWLQIIRKTGAAYGINEPLLIYRLSPNSKSSNRVHSGMMIFQTYRHVGYGRIVSSLLTVRYAVHSISKRMKIRNGCR